MSQMMMILLVTLVVLVHTIEAVSKPDFVEALLVKDHPICHRQCVVSDYIITKQIHAVKFAAIRHGFSDILVRHLYFRTSLARLKAPKSSEKLLTFAATMLDQKFQNRFI